MHWPYRHDPEYLKLLEGSVPVSRDDPRRAKDFVKCTDPHCKDRGRQYDGVSYPHCHPIF